MSKHAELIKRWADGAIIQGRPEDCTEWETLGPPGSDTLPHWYDHFEYREKPEDVVERPRKSCAYTGWTAETAEDLFSVLCTLSRHFQSMGDAHGAQLLARVWRLNSPILKRIDEELK